MRQLQTDRETETDRQEDGQRQTLKIKGSSEGRRGAKTDKSKQYYDAGN